MSRIAELVNNLRPLDLRSAGPFPQPKGAWLRRRPGSIIRTAQRPHPFLYARALPDTSPHFPQGRSRGPSLHSNAQKLQRPNVVFIGDFPLSVPGVYSTWIHETAEVKPPFGAGGV
jgi:hypothetical protein